MITGDPVLYRQIPVIQKIIQDETWLEGERRGCHVASTDCVVRENVCRVILQVGQQIRESVSKDLPPNIAERMQPQLLVPPDGMDWEI